MARSEMEAKEEEGRRLILKGLAMRPDLIGDLRKRATIEEYELAKKARLKKRLKAAGAIAALLAATGVAGWFWRRRAAQVQARAEAQTRALDHARAQVQAAEQAKAQAEKKAQTAAQALAQAQAKARQEAQARQQAQALAQARRQAAQAKAEWAARRGPSGIANAPVWVGKGSGLFNDAGRPAFYGVGSVTGISNGALAIAAADARARAETERLMIKYRGPLFTRMMTGLSHCIVNRWRDPSGATTYSLCRIEPSP